MSDPTETLTYAEQVLSETKTFRSLHAQRSSVTGLVNKIHKETTIIESMVDLDPATMSYPNRSRLEGANRRRAALVLELRAKCDELLHRMGEMRESSLATKNDSEMQIIESLARFICENSDTDSSQESMLRTLYPVIADKYCQRNGEFYVRTDYETFSTWTKVDPAKLAAIVTTTKVGDIGNVFRAIVALANYTTMGEETPEWWTPAVRGISRAWASYLSHVPRFLEQALPNKSNVPIVDYVMPMSRTHDMNVTCVDLRTGRDYTPDSEIFIIGSLVEHTEELRHRIDDEIPEDKGARWLNSFVAHHFPEPWQQRAFYREIGIALYGYGMENLLVVKGVQGGGKDSLISCLMEILGGSCVSLPFAALTGKEEAGDLKKLASARMAFCSFEGGTERDDRYHADTIKTITGGGRTPITVRGKYGRTAEDVYFRGSLVLFSNHDLRFTGDDTDGLNRRVVVVPMYAAVPEVPDMFGFHSWDEAAKASAPYLASRAWDAYSTWVHVDHAPGRSNAQKRMPSQWKLEQERMLHASDVFNWIPSVFVPIAGTDSLGDRCSLVLDTVMDITSALGLHAKRGTMLQRMAKKIPTARFPGMAVPMESFQGRYPVTIDTAAIQDLALPGDVEGAILLHIDRVRASDAAALVGKERVV